MLRATAALLSGSLLSSGCDSSDDPGEVAFVDRAVPALLGRRVQGAHELRVLVEISLTEGRGDLVDLLLTQPQLADYWAQVLIDGLGVQRSGTKAQDRACFDEVTLADADQAQLARDLLTEPPSVALQAGFTFRDVLEGALANDDLAPIFVSYLPMVWTVDAIGRSPALEQQASADRFLDVYLGRDFMCMGCHNGSYSTTDLHSGTDRYSVQLDLDAAIFGYTDATGAARFGGHGGDTVRGHLDATFRHDVLAQAAGSGPWGMDLSCVTGPGVVGFATFAPSAGSNAAMLGRPVDASWSAFDLVSALQSGVSAYDPTVATAFPAPSPGFDAGVASGVDCSGCHAGEEDRARTSSDGKILAALQTVPLMAGLVGSDDETAAVDFVHAVRAHKPAYEGDTPPTLADPDSALARAVALKVVDLVLAELTGAPATIDHGFARNRAQEMVRQTLANTLIDSGWSLRALLREIVLDPRFVIEAPETSGHDTSEWLPAVLYPWVDLDDVVPEDEGNSAGDFVHRRSVPALLTQLASAFGWPAPGAFDRWSYTYSSSAGLGETPVRSWPHMETMTSLGRPESDATPGLDTPTFDTYWTWEALLSDGQKPAVIRCGDVAACYSGDDDAKTVRAMWKDYADVLVAALAETPTLTMAEVGGVIRDRVLGDPTPDPDAGERDAFAAFLEEVVDTCDVDGDGDETWTRLSATDCADLDDTVDGGGVATMSWADYTSWMQCRGCMALSGETGKSHWQPYASQHERTPDQVIRLWAGALAATPDFVLAGLPRANPDVTPPTLDVCMSGEACGYDALCTQWAAALDDAGLLDTFACALEPDLALATPEVASVVWVGSGHDVSWTLTVTNLGGGAALPTEIVVSVPWGGGSTQWVDGLGPGASADLEVTVHVPASGLLRLPSVSGTVKLEVGPAERETQTGNNLQSVLIASSMWKPDLVVEGACNDAGRTYAGVRNVGYATAGSNTLTIRGALSSTSTAVPSLVGGGFAEVSTVTPSGASYTVTADAFSRVRESNEANNTLTTDSAACP